jgi:DNA uptake protein ComE-like DNA-binding protein
MMKTFAAFALATLLTIGGAVAQTSPTAPTTTTPSTATPSTATTPPATTTTTTPKPHKTHKAKKTDAAATTPAAADATSTTASPATTPAATATAAKPAKSASTTASKLPPGTKVNINTATPEQLDALPSVGKSRVNAIVTERAKGPFKDWNDFDTRMAHTSVNAGVKTKIKDLVTF